MSDYSLYRSSIFHCVENTSTVEADYYADGLMVVQHGKIIELGCYDQLIGQFGIDARVTHFEDSLIIPGFVDSHLHYPQYRIIASYGATLLDWLNKYTFVEEQKFNDRDYSEEVAELFLDELIRNGTTTAMTFCTSHPESVEVFFSAAQNRNLRMVAGKVMMDRNAPIGLCDDVNSSYADSKALIEKWHNKNRLSYAITPRFALTSTEAQLTQAGKLLIEYPNSKGTKGVLLQTHMNENSDEISWVQELYPQSKHYFDVYDSCGLAGSNSVFGHCIHNTQDEYQRMADTDSKVALCPTSNLFLGSGLFNLDRFDNYGITTSLASDVGGGDSFSMFSVMNEAYKICKLNGNNLDPVQAFYLTTLAGAKVLNMDDCIGNFETNKEADFVVLDLNASELIKQRLKSANSIDDILFCLMTLGDARLVSRVYILGQCAYQKMEAH
ncbi:MAG: guanine deaminase [Gammaproteobacteria bacterium]|nr:guanine deaminase [Gammaproteobacteria bacterium]